MVLRISVWGPVPAAAQAIPEPPYLIYGQIFNPAGGTNSRVTTGTLTWTFQPSAGSPLAGSPPVVVTTTCTSQYAPYGFLLEVPCQSALTGLPPSANALAVTFPAQTYDQTSVQMNGTNIFLKYTVQSQLSLTNRGQMVEVDLTLLQSDQVAGGNVLPDAWQFQYFGHTGVDPSAINASGMSNLGSYLAGTNPNDPHGAFRLVSATPRPNGSVTVSWTSVPSHTYTLRRVSSLSAGFQVIASGVPAATNQTTTSYLDTPTAGSRGYFYQVSIP